MALTAAQHIALALEASHSGTGKAAQALANLNLVLSSLSGKYDFAEARGQFNFIFSPNQSPPIVSAVFQQGPLTAGGIFPAYPGNQFGSGPYALPVDYLRLSGSSGSSGSQKSFIWWLNGVPYPVIPMDLAEFDMQVQQSGLQSFVWLSATDMSTPIDDRILLTTTGDVTAGSIHIANLASSARLIGGNVLGVAGQGIVPGTMLTALATTDSGPLTPGGGGGLTAGGGTVITPGGGSGTASGVTLSQPANATITGASLIFGYCPNVFIYPPPQSALQAMIRYQKRMPDIFDTTRFPWCHFDMEIQDALTSRMCTLNDDDRDDRIMARALGSLTLALASKDDDPSHAKRVELDRRRFGRAYFGGDRGITKRVGW